MRIKEIKRINILSEMFIDPLRVKIILQLLKKDSLSFSDLSKGLGTAKHNITTHMTFLLVSGLCTASKKGGTRRFTLTSKKWIKSYFEVIEKAP